MFLRIVFVPFFDCVLVVVIIVLPLLFWVFFFLFIVLLPFDFEYILILASVVLLTLNEWRLIMRVKFFPFALDLLRIVLAIFLLASTTDDSV